MSFLHTRDAGALVSRCQQCGHVIRARMDRDVFAEQRAHSWQSCQQRRTETARVVEAERAAAQPSPIPRAPSPVRTHCRDNHEYTPENTRIDSRGRRVCKTCEVRRVQAWRERQKEAAMAVPTTSTGRPQVVHNEHAETPESPTFAAFFSAGMGVGWTKMEEQSEVAPGLTPGPPLDSPFVDTRKEAVDS